MILKNRILRQERCLIQQILEPGQDPAWCDIPGGEQPPQDPAGIVPGAVGRVTPRQDPPVVPLLQELPLLRTSGHSCRADPSTSIPREVQK